LRDLADPAPAQKACDDFESAVCTHDDKCRPGTCEDCLSSLKVGLNCANAIGAMLTYEQCMADIPNAGCSNASLPSTCTDVLLF
jgi:hypothetical protein